MTETAMKPGRYAKNLGALLLFYLPILYIGIILAVSLHEIVGHGCAALIMGGRFKGFAIYPDGMGWANIDMEGLPAPRMAFVLLSGGLSTSLAALILFTLGIFLRKRPSAHAALLMCAFVCLMDGVPYFFWDAVYLSGVGDFSVIWMLFPNGLLRIAVISLGGLSMVAGIIAFNALFYKISYRLISEDGLLPPGRRIALSIILFFLQTAGWFAFPWNELVPGVGLLPGITALSLTAAVQVFLTSGRVAKNAAAIRESAPRASPRSWAPTIAAWAACLITVCSTLFWSSRGVSF